ncbi:hypothetical protein HER39_01990, partial [Arthrobacter deserti]|nr:hypothetical protein [Arthrobacter deserti]
MAYIEPRKRKNGTTKYYVHWKEPLTGAAMHEKCDSLDDSKFLLTVLKAHDDLEKAHAAVVNFYGEKYTVSKMVREHIAILTSAAGYTVRRYEGYVKNHLDGALGERAAADVEYRDIMGWVRTMKDKGLKPKTVANVHGL